MVIVVFRSRLREEHAAEFHALADRMEEIARSMPGFISYQVYVADDGERVSIHEWETSDQLKAWRELPEHAAAQELGREKFYEDYSLFVSDGPRESRFNRQP